MRDIDTLIQEALSQEEREILSRIGDRPGLVERALGMFGAGGGWMVSLMIVIQTLLFLAGLWAAWMFFEATEPVTQLRWGLPAAVLMLVALAIKLSPCPRDSSQSDQVGAETYRASGRAHARMSFTWASLAGPYL